VINLNEIYAMSPSLQPRLQASFPASPRVKPATLASLLDLCFSFSGRIPRRTYWKGLAALHACFILVMLTAFALIPSSSDGTLELGTTGLIIAGLLAALWAWCLFSLHIKRWQDRGRDGFWVVLYFIPPVQLWLFIECGFLRGTIGPNRYGGDPT